MMNYQSRRNRNSGPSRIAAMGMLIVVAVATGIHFMAPHFYQALFTSVARPFWRAEFSFESGSLRTEASLLRENEELKRALIEADVRLASVRAVEEENALLKATFERASSTPRLLAAVLKKPPFVPYDRLVIDVGNDHGLSTSSLVYAPGDVLVGRIDAVLGKTSTVALFSSPGERYQVLIGEGNVPATVSGRGGGQYRAELPRAAEIREGDFVHVPSLDSAPFGIVTAILSDPADPFESVLFAPPINIYELRWVLVQK